MRSITAIGIAGLLVATVANASVVINEVDYQNPATNQTEWIELLGPAGTDLTDWSLVLKNQDGLAYNTVTLSGVIPNDFTSAWGGAGGFFVMGVFDAATAGAFGSPDLTPPGWLSNQIQNGPDDVIQLLDPTGLLVDEWEYDDSDGLSVTGLSEPVTASDAAGTSGDVTTYSSIGRAGYNYGLPLFVFDLPHGVGSVANDTFDHENNSADYWAWTPLGAMTEATGPEIRWSGYGAGYGITPGTFNYTFYDGGGQDTFTINIVPEPATLALVALGGVAVIARRRRR
jgi:hypothetical protein